MIELSVLLINVIYYKRVKIIIYRNLYKNTNITLGMASLEQYAGIKNLLIKVLLYKILKITMKKNYLKLMIDIYPLISRE